MLILISTLVFWIFNPKSIFGQVWAKKVKVVHLSWKFTHRISQGSWFLFCHYFFEVPTQNLFLGKFQSKKVKVVCFSWKLVYGVSRGCWSYCDISFFWISNPKSNIGQIWAEKVKAVRFAWKLTYSISTMLIPILMLVFSNFKPNSRACWFLFWD